MSGDRIRRFIGAATVAVMLMPTAGAATFRVTSKIYTADQSDASAEHWILFDNGLVYDLPQIEDRFVTVFDPGQQRVTLLDRQDQVQTTLSTTDLLKVAAQARAAASSPQQKERIGLNATVEPSQRVVGYAIRFGNLEYHTTTQTPDDPALATDYGQFTLLASQLNIVRRLGPPPFARMTLCQYMTKRGELPLDSMLMVHRGDQLQQFRCTHELQELSKMDRVQIEEVRGMIALYREVPLSEFP